MDGEIKKAERRGYSKGYSAGTKRNRRDISHEDERRKRDAFWQRAFIAALPAAFAAQGWKRGEELIISLNDRVRLAADTADEAVKRAAKHL